MGRERVQLANGRRITRTQLAYGLLFAFPAWTDREVSEAAGLHVSALYRDMRYRRLRVFIGQQRLQELEDRRERVRERMNLDGHPEHPHTRCRLAELGRRATCG